MAEKKAALTPAQKSARKAARTRKLNAGGKRMRKAVHAKHLATDLGLAGTAAEMLFARPTNAASGSGSVFETMFPPNGNTRTLQQNLSLSGTVIKDKATDLSTYKYAGLGILASAVVPKIPFVGRRFNRVVKDTLKGWEI